MFPFAKVGVVNFAHEFLLTHLLRGYLVLVVSYSCS